MFGRELAHDPGLSRIERLYIRIFGAPVQGLRVRARYVLPECEVPARVILDAGCGRGAFALHLARTRPESLIIAVEYDERRIRQTASTARSLGLSNIRFVRTDLLKPGLQRGRFDLVISVDVLEDFDDDLTAARMLSQLLSPAGRLVLHTPSFERFWFFRWGPNFDAPGHARPGYRQEDLVAICRKAALRVDSLRATYGRLETLANNISYLITGARERRKALYAIAFPFLLFLSWLGSGANPKRGIGHLLTASPDESR